MNHRSALSAKPALLACALGSFLFAAFQSYASGAAAGAASVRPDAALEMLKAGNLRFTSGSRAFPGIDEARRAETASKGQTPFATVLYCADSRVPIEHIFDAGIGDLFGVRVAGNVADTDEIGTIEYGTEHLGTPVVLVLGHSSCGAVTAVARGDEVGGSIPLLVDNIGPAVEKAKKTAGASFSPALLDAAIEANVWQAIADLLEGSAIVRELVEEGKVVVEGAIYHLDSGKVDWLGEHAEQEALLETEVAAQVEGLEQIGAEIGGDMPLPSPYVWILTALLAAALLALYLKLFSPRYKSKSVKVATKLLLAGTVSVLTPLFVVAVLALDGGILGGGEYALAAALGLVALGSLAFSIASMRNIGVAITSRVKKLEKELKEARGE